MDGVVNGRFRLGVVGLLVVTGALGACSLLVDTSGFSGGQPDAGAEAAVDAASDATAAGDASADAATERSACDRWGGLAKAAYWPTRGGCLTRAGRTNMLGPDTPHLAWQVVADAGSYAPPTVDEEGTVYFGTELDKNAVLALRSTGALKWARVGGNVSNAITVGADGTLYASAGTPDAGVHALAGDGAERWHAGAPDESDTSPAVTADGTVVYGSYATTPDGGGWAFAAFADGGPRWTVHLAGEGGTAAIGADGTIFMVGGAKLYALTPDGGEKWSTDLAADCSSPTLAPDDTLYLVCADGTLRSFGAGGAPGFTYTTNGLTVRGPALAEDGTIYVGSSDEQLHAVHPDGTRAWVYDAQTAVGAPLVSGDGTIYAGGADGSVHAVSPSGARKWTFPLSGNIDAQPAIGAGANLYVVAQSGVLYALAP
jgi:outer membrane protein assembly factor BamB